MNTLHHPKIQMTILNYIRSAVFLLLIVIYAQGSNAQTFVEGQHYTIVQANAANPASKGESPSVVEYFSFACPGCYAMEPSIVTLEKVVPDLSLRRVHMPFGGANAKYAQKVFVLMQLLDAQQYKDAIFRRIHVARNSFNSDKEIIEFYTELGFESNKVQSLLKSFSADGMIRKMNKDAVKYKVKSVPTIIVNDKYQVNLGALPQSNSLIGIVNYLHTLP